MPPPCGSPGNPGATSNTVRTVAVGQTFVPAVQVTEVCDCITNGNEQTMGQVGQDATVHDDFTVCGALRTSACAMAQENACEENCWSTQGADDCTYHEGHTTCCPCKCDCHPMHKEDFGEFGDTHCDCDHDHHHKECQDPIKDIEHRINKQVDQVLSEILSNAVKNCIASSLEGCI